MSVHPFEAVITGKLDNSDSDSEPSDRVAIYLDAKARFLGDGYDARVVLKRLHQYGLTEWMFRAVELQHRLERRMSWRRVR